MGARLQDKVAIVTGGSSGIGAAIAARLVEEGARVIVADIAPPTITADGAAFVETDVTRRTTARLWFAPPSVGSAGSTC